jgi:hypothetical protein
LTLGLTVLVKAEQQENVRGRTQGEIVHECEFWYWDCLFHRQQLTQPVSSPTFVACPKASIAGALKANSGHIQ